MAEKTPVSKGNALFIDPDRQIWAREGALTGGAITTIGTRINKLNLQHRCYYVNDADDAQTLTLGVPGIVQVAWQADTSSNETTPFVTDRAAGALEFNNNDANSNGYLHVWSLGFGTAGLTPATSDVAVATTAATSNFIEPLRGIRGEARRSPTTQPTLTTAGDSDTAGGITLPKEQFLHQAWWFEDLDDADTWTSGLPGLFAAAWTADDPNGLNDPLAAWNSNRATGQLTFQGANNSTGMLHTWRRG